MTHDPNNHSTQGNSTCTAITHGLNSHSLREPALVTAMTRDLNHSLKETSFILL